MKLNEIVYAIKGRLKSTSDDSNNSNRYIAFLVNTKRAKFIRQDLTQVKRTIDSSVLQTICLPTEITKSSECGCNISSTCSILRTKDPLPALFDSHFKTVLTRVASVKRLDTPFTIVTKARAQYASYSPFSNTVQVYLDTDNRLYFVGKSNNIKLLKNVSITGVFENPFDLERIDACTGTAKCFTMNSEYPVPAHMVDTIITSVVLDLSNSEQFLEDIVNDGEDTQQ